MKVHREIDQLTTINPKSRGGLLPSHGGEGHVGVGGGGEAVERDSSCGPPPPILLWRQATNPMFIGFWSMPPSVTNKIAGVFIYCFKLKHAHTRKIKAKQMLHGSKSPMVWPRYSATPWALLCTLLVFSWPTIACWIRLKNFQAFSLTLPFSESHSCWNVKYIKRRFFCIPELNTKIMGTLWNSRN
jgi:hypothetical protein